MIPTPRDILLRRIELHRYYREPNVVRELSRRLRRLDRTGRWPPVIDCSPLARSLVDLDLPLRFCRRLERFGIVYAGELATWTPERLKLLDPRRGDELVARAREALASVGLSLGMSHFSTLGHRQPPLTAWLVRRRHRKRRRLSSTRKQIICDLLAQGLSEREISRRLGYRSHTTVWAVKREMRRAGGRRAGESGGAVSGFGRAARLAGLEALGHRRGPSQDTKSSGR